METLRQYAVQNEWRNGRVVWGWGNRLNGNVRAAQRELGQTCETVRKALKKEIRSKRSAKDTRVTGRAAAVVAGWDQRGWRPIKTYRKGPDINDHGREYSSDEDGDGPRRRTRLRGKQKENKAVIQKEGGEKVCSLNKEARSADWFETWENDEREMPELVDDTTGDDEEKEYRRMLEEEDDERGQARARGRRGLKMRGSPNLTLRRKRKRRNQSRSPGK
jgi:hypothetical protein